MLREFSPRSKINAILEKKMRESRKIAPQNDPCNHRSCDYLPYCFVISKSIISNHPDPDLSSSPHRNPDICLDYKQWYRVAFPDIRLRVVYDYKQISEMRTPLWRHGVRDLT